MWTDTKAQGSIISFFIGMMITLIVALTVTWPAIDNMINATSSFQSQNVQSTSGVISPITTLEVTPVPILNVGDPIKSTNLNIHAEKTKVAVGEDILVKLSAVNLITKKTMHIQIILTPPSGISVSSSNFVFSGAGQYTSDYKIEPGQGRDIEINMIANQVGDFKIDGRAVYYFGDDIINSEDYVISVPITVTGTGVQTEQTQVSPTQTINGTLNMSETAKAMVYLISLLMGIFFIIIVIRPLFD